jgi:hypothetical protein
LSVEVKGYPEIAPPSWVGDPERDQRATKWMLEMGGA